MYSCIVHGWSSHLYMCPSCQIVTTSTGTATPQITITEIDLAFENVSLEDKYKSSLKMLEEMAGALKRCSNNAWGCAFSDDLSGYQVIFEDSQAALENYRKWKEGMK